MNRTHEPNEGFKRKSKKPTDLIIEQLAEAHMSCQDALDATEEALKYSVDHIEQQKIINTEAEKITSRLHAMLIDLRVLMEFAPAKNFTVIRENGDAKETTYQELFLITRKKIFKEENFDADVGSLIAALGNAKACPSNEKHD